MKHLQEPNSQGSTDPKPSSAPPKAEPQPPLAAVLDRNIQTLVQLRKHTEACRSWHDRVVHWVASFIGSVRFAYLHILGFAIWATINSRWILAEPFDPFPFTGLAALASFEAILLSTFVLINQRRTNALVERREDLDLQVSLITEHEITRVLHVCDLIAKQLNINTESTVADLEESKKDLSPEMVLNRIDLAVDQVSVNPKDPH